MAMSMYHGLSPEAWRQLERFCRQVLQLQLNLDYPDQQWLRSEAFQENLYASLFQDSDHPPPQRYQLRILKELTKRIENSIQNWEEEAVSDNLMNHLATLLSSPLPLEIASPQQKSYVTYTISSLIPLSSKECTPSYPTIPERPYIPTITLLEARNLVAASGTTGLRTWEAALHLGNYLISCPTLVNSKRILELGSGTGYLSILCARYLKASHILATDGSGDVVASLSTNFFLNALQDSERLEGKELRWGYALVGGEQPEWNGGRGLDLVIGADVTYDTTVIPMLVATFRDLFDLYPEVKILIAATVRNESTVTAFVTACQANKFGVEEINYPITATVAQEGPFYSDAVPIKIVLISKS